MHRSTPPVQYALELQDTAANGKLIESGKCIISQKSCINDATKFWNQLPIEVAANTSLFREKNMSVKLDCFITNYYFYFYIIDTSL